MVVKKKTGEPEVYFCEIICRIIMTNWTVNLRDFLNKKMDEEKIKSNKHAERIGVPLTTFRAIINLSRKPEIKTIVKIAEYFSCSITELLYGEDVKLPKNKLGYAKLTIEELSDNLRTYIKGEMAKRGLNQYQLGRAIGHSDDAFRHFLREDRSEY